MEHLLPKSMTEHHSFHRIGWLRAAVLGANDGIVSSASLIVGVAASRADQSAIIVAGVAGLVAGAMSMAAGEYVSVSSQSDTEKADLATEKLELKNNPIYERDELAIIYVNRGLDADLAKKVAEQLMAHDALGAHARDELGFSATSIARPVQAAFASGVCFTLGGVFPLLLVFMFPRPFLIVGVSCASLFFLAGLGALAARAGGAPLLRSIFRVTFWGALAMGMTAWIGALFGAIV